MSSRRSRVFTELLAVRGVALASLAVLASVGLYLTSRGAELRAFQRARANGEYVNGPECPSVIQEREPRLSSEELDEVSGMAASRSQPGLLWVHNDSGDSARIFAIRLDGELRAEVVLDGVSARDFEDIAIQASADGDRIYVADTGDNLKTRDFVQLLVLPEPHIPRAGTAVKLHRTPRAIRVTYDDGKHDVEAMFVDARGDMYLVNKSHPLSYLGRDGIYRVSAADLERDHAVARRVSELAAGPATAADISPDGHALAVRNYHVAFWWPLAEGESPLAAFERRPCRFWLREPGSQGEALTFLPDGSGFLTVTEGKRRPILRYRYGPPELTN